MRIIKRKGGGRGGGGGGEEQEHTFLMATGVCGSCKAVVAFLSPKETIFLGRIGINEIQRMQGLSF